MTIDIQERVTVKVSRADRVAKPARTTWGEQSETQVARDAGNTSFSVMDYRAPAGFGPPRHFHFEQEEVFVIHRGTIVVWTPESSFTLGPGDVMSLPQQVTHTWRAYGNDPVHITVVVSPGSERGLEHFFDRIVDRHLSLDDMGMLAAAAEESGMQVVGPPLTDAEVNAIVAGEMLH